MRYILFLFLLFGLLLVAGCTVYKPSFKNCCRYENATNDLCVAANGTIYSDTRFCDMESLFCNVTEDGAEIQLPVCPKSELLRCNSSCVGMFCGSFEFDPRPPIGLDVEDLNESKDKNPRDVDSSQYGGMEREGAVGLYKGECRLLDMTPATIRASTNTNGGFALNMFRFGVGSSFADFDEASMYYPLTDLACGINPFGTVDRYVNYYIPNIRGSGGGELCEEYVPGELEIPQYVCAFDADIRSYSYQDCAIRCSLKYYGDEPAVEPYNAYLTERNGKVAGNPFAYGLRRAAIGVEEASAKEYRPEDIYKSYPGATDFVDDYPLGYNYYGAEFEKNNWPMSDYRGGIGFVLTARGQPYTEDSEVIYDYYSGRYETQIVMDWPGEGDEDDVIENFITVERDPHLLYAFLLSHHSVYSKQFREGHYLPDARWAPGAEFECTPEGNECLSGYCNVQDYKRGVCFRTDGKEVPCDCWYDYEKEGGVVCQGRQRYKTNAVDNRNEIEATAVLAAPVDTRAGGAPYQDRFYMTSLPSKGRVVVFNPKEMIGREEEVDDDVAFLVILLGGEDAYPTFIARTYHPNPLNEEDQEEMRNKMLTIPQVLSPEKWDGCSAYPDCGKFYTTFVEECVPTYEEDPEFYDDAFDVCYSGNFIFGTTLFDDFYTGWRGMYIDSADGQLKNENWNCKGIAAYDLVVPEGKKTGGSVFCYEWTATGHCASYATSALVIRARPVRYTGEDGLEVEGYAFGNCILDGDTLRTKTYGYCEQCSYLTMAKEKVVSLPEDKADPGYVGTEGRKDNKYCPSLLMKTILPPSEYIYLESSYGGQFGWWESGGVNSPPGRYRGNEYSECQMPDGSEVGKQQAWPDYLPNAYYLKTKIKSYLQRNIMPVIFADDGGLYRIETSDGETMLEVFVNDRGDVDAGKTTHPYLAEVGEKKVFLLDQMFRTEDGGYATVGTYLADSMMNLGAGIIVIKNLNSSDMENYPGGTPGWRNIDGMLHFRGRAIKTLCPNCMVAVSAGYADGSSDADKMRLVSQMFNYRNLDGAPLWDDYSANLSCIGGEATCVPPVNIEVIDQVDLIATKWELGRGNSHCDIEDEQERFNAILDDEVEFGAKMLKRFGKPVVVTDFIIVRDEPAGCWNDESAKRFMEFLGMHVEDLVRSGHIGIIYGDWTYGHSGSAGTTSIRTRERTEGYRGPFFEGTLGAAKEFSGYQKTTTVSEIKVKDNCTCVPCTATDSAEICNGRFAGTGPECEWSGRRIMVKWPDNCITEEACMGAEELAMYELVCNLTIGGQQQRRVVDGVVVASNPGLFKQMIASIEGADALPCLENKTYRKAEITKFLSHPLLFRKDGNLSFACTPLGLGEGQFCGPVPQIDVGGMSCRLEMKRPEGRPGEVPIPGEGWVPGG